MDTIDRKIIRCLQEDGRLTNQELAAPINLSPWPCLRRVRNLERAGVLIGYAAIIDQERYGLPINVFVSIRLERQTDSAISAFEQGIQCLDEVLACYLMTGSRDYLLRVISHSLKSYGTFLREKLTAIEGISVTESSFALGQVKRRAAFPPLTHFVTA